MASDYFVYLITNLINGKFYVGKSVSPINRWRDHKKIALGGKEKYPMEFFAVHAALKKYGIDNFKFEVIERFETEDEAYYFETWWIEFLETYKKANEYNCNRGGEGGIHPTKETLAKLITFQNLPEIKQAKSERMKFRHQTNPGFLSDIHKGNQYTKGRVPTKAEREHLSKVFTGRVVSEKTKRKMSLAQSGEKHSQAKLTEQDVLEIRKQFDKLVSGKKQFCKEMADKYGVSSGTIEDVVYRLSWTSI